MRIPDFFIVGAPKAGTSALFVHLGEHPEICVSSNKEPHFFGRDQHLLGHERRTLEEYLALFGEAEAAVRVGEASTNYLYSRTAADEIKAFSPDASIIVMLRDPVAVMHAYHGSMVAGGFEPIPNFGDALVAETERRAGRSLPNRRGIRESLYYRDLADFEPHLRRFLDVFGADRVRVILFDDWISASEGVYRDTLSFLGVRPDFRPQLGVVNPSKRVRSVRLHNFVLEPPPRAQAVVRALLPDSVRLRLHYRLRSLNVRVAPRKAIDPALLRELRAEFAPKVERLGDL